MNDALLNLVHLMNNLSKKRKKEQYTVAPRFLKAIRSNKWSKTDMFES